MPLRMPRLNIRDLLLTVYAVVWGTVVIITRLQGEQVDEKLWGLLAAGVLAISLAFQDRDKPGSDREEP